MQKELADAKRNRWFVLFAIVFTSLSLALSLLGLSGLGTLGVTGFGRTTASLLNLVLLIVPLMGLLMGALSVATEREQGTLVSILAQPVTPREVLLGKFLGLAAALAGTVLFGFGVSGLVVAHYAGATHIGDYLTLIAFTLLLGLVNLGLGLCLSILVRRGSTAVGLALLLWLVFLILSDLGMMGTTVVLNLTPAQLLWLSLLNPGQIFKLAAVGTVQGSLEVLGPSALYAATVFGPWRLAALTALLAIWVVVPLLVGLQLFPRRAAL